jgi:5-carboxymethyl-2-hydroxymuconate isomerase
MPQITLEYSSNVAPPVSAQELLGAVHRMVASTIGLPIENCKSRALVRDTFRVGDGGDNGAFVHAEIRILAGRAPEMKRELGENLLEYLTGAFRPVSETLDLQITVEVQDIERDGYFKWPPGTLGGKER